MGNSSPAPISPEITSRFELIRRLEGQNLFLLEEISTRREYLMRQLRYSNNSEYLQAVDHLEYKKNTQASPYLTPLREYITRAEDEYCVSHHRIFALFEYPHHNLEHQILERSCQKRRFMENEVWSILVSCIHGLAHLEKNGTSHECLRSDQILLMADGSIQVADPFCNSIGTNYDLLYDNLNVKHLYPSPQLCHALEEGHTQPPHAINQFRSDVFSVGMIMLEVGLVESQDGCYLMHHRSINWQKLHANLQRLREKYGPELYQVIEMMLKRDWRQRPDWVELEHNVGKQRGSLSSAGDLSRIRQNTPLETVTVTTNQQTLPTTKEQPVGAIPVDQNRVPVGHATSQQQSRVNTQQTTVISTPPQNGFLIHSNYGLPSNAPPMDLIVPIQPSNILLSKPKINLSMGRPADGYETRTRIDENLVEVIDEDSQRESYFPGKLKESALKFATNFQPDNFKPTYFGAQKGTVNNEANLFTPSSFMTGLKTGLTGTSTAMTGFTNFGSSGVTPLLSLGGTSGILKNNLAGLTSASTTNITFNCPSSGYGASGSQSYLPLTSNNYLGTPSFKSPYNTTFDYSSGSKNPSNGYPGSLLGTQAGAKGSIGTTGLDTTTGIPSIGLGSNHPLSMAGLGTNSSSTSYGIGSNPGAIGISSGAGIIEYGASKGLTNISSFPALNLQTQTFKTPGLGGLAISTNSIGTDFSKFNPSSATSSYSSTYADKKNTLPAVGGIPSIANPGIRTPVQFSLSNATAGPKVQDKTKNGMFTDTNILTAGISRQRSQSQDKFATDPLKFGSVLSNKTELSQPNRNYLPPPSAVATSVPVRQLPPSPVMEMLKGIESMKQSNPGTQISQSNLQFTTTPPPSQTSNLSTFSFNNLKSQSVPIEQKKEETTTEMTQSFNVNSLLQGINYPLVAPKQDNAIFTDYSKLGIVRGGGGVPYDSTNPNVMLSLEKKPTLVESLGTPADALSSMGSAQFNSKTSIDMAGVGGRIVDRTGSASQVDSDYKANPVVMSFESIVRQPSRSVVENVGAVGGKPSDAITQSTSNDQQENKQPNNLFRQTKDLKINIIDHEELRKNEDLKFPQAQPTLVESQEINSLETPAVLKPDATKFVVETFKQGSRYEGEKVNDMRHGKGKFYYQDGGLYDGDWKQNRMDGHGKLYYQSGKLAYDGQWKNDQFCGHGILYNQYPQRFDENLDFENFEEIEEYWTKFEGIQPNNVGNFKDDLKEGKGTLHFINGEYFDGVFNKDAISGPGEFHRHDGSIFKGTWDNNRLVQQSS